MAVGAPASPAASRLPRRRWRDWRLVLGLVMVLGSAVAGSYLVSTASDTVDVWAAAADLAEGEPLRASDLVAVPVRIEAAQNPYLAGPIPDSYLLVRPVGAGELLPSSAVAPRSEAAGVTRLVAVSLDGGAVPGPLAVGDRVDVWVVPRSTATLAASPDDPGSDVATLLVAGVSVASVPEEDVGFATAIDQDSVVLRLDEGAVSAGTLGRDVAADAGAGADGDLTDLVAAVVTASAEGRVVLTVDPAPR